MTNHRLFSLFLLCTTVLLLSACRPEQGKQTDVPGTIGTGTSDASAGWSTTRSGHVDESSIFYSQFGPAPFDIGVSPDTDKPGTGKTGIAAGTHIRLRVFSANKDTVIFTAFMEKQPDNSGMEGDWLFSATDSNNQPIAIDSSCLDCHRQRANNNYLFSLPAPTP